MNIARALCAKASDTEMQFAFHAPPVDIAAQKESPGGDVSLPGDSNAWLRGGMAGGAIMVWVSPRRLQVGPWDRVLKVAWTDWFESYPLGSGGGRRANTTLRASGRMRPQWPSPRVRLAV